MYPYCKVYCGSHNKCRVEVHRAEDDSECIYTGKTKQGKLRDILTEVLEQYPTIRFRSSVIQPSDKRLHIFQVRKPEETAGRRFIKTHEEVPNPFRNRKRYAMVNPTAIVSFDTLDL